MEYRTTKSKIPVSERRVINSGYAWTRFLMVPVFLSGVSYTYYEPDRWTGPVTMTVAVILFYLLKRARKIKYDDENVYIIRGKKEKVIPFTSIVSIKKSAAKVNGSHFWKLRYKDEQKKQRTIRILEVFLIRIFWNLYEKQTLKWLSGHIRFLIIDQKPFYSSEGLRCVILLTPLIV